ncbi:hypothetical protein DFH11DRAFT_1641032 [Phellopilus nigrolimitatus]|nr:hypothetical protein DFH11DRAFT_1641032 [Phellopilus nigrolimitatus]
MADISLENLPLDIRDRLLTFLADFVCLRNAVLASKRLHEVYVLRKRSITRAVAQNTAGPALPFAVALVRTKSTIAEKRLDEILDGLDCPDAESAYWTIDVKPAEELALMRVSSVSFRLESHFCNLYKDRSAPTSVLTDVEAFKLDRSLYRIWTVSALGKAPGRLDNGNVSLGFLKNLSDEELAEMHEATSFLDNVYGTSDFSAGRYSRPLGIEPDSLLHLFDNQASAYPEQSMRHVNPQISMALTTLFNERNARRLLAKKFGGLAILQTRVEELQTCQNCAQQAQMLFGENNWHWLWAHLKLDVLLNLLPGYLSYNNDIRSEFIRMFKSNPSGAQIIGLMLSEMFDSQNDPASGWKRTDWLCLGCLQIFIRRHLFSYYVNQLVKGTSTNDSTCWSR